MPKTKPKKRQSNLINSVSRLSRRSMLIVAAFALVFVGIGTLYIGKSQASGLYCTHNTYSYAPYTKKICVIGIQEGLQLENDLHGSSVPSPGRADGYFGGNTLNSLKKYESNILHEYPDGVVSAYGKVWYHLCVDGHNYGWYNFNDSGCYNWPY